MDMFDSYGGPSEAAARLTGFFLDLSGFPPSLSGPPPSPSNEWRASTWKESIMTVDATEANVCLHEVRAGIEGVLVLLEQQSVRSESCFSALCLLELVKAKRDALMAEGPLGGRIFARPLLELRSVIVLGWRGCFAGAAGDLLSVQATERRQRARRLSGWLRRRWWFQRQ
jgi:hypothetical protein